MVSKTQEVEALCEAYEQACAQANIHHTPYGAATIGFDATHLTATGEQLRAWASRPFNAWPCSTLARCSRVQVTLATRSGDLVDMDTSPEECSWDIAGDELAAWTSTVLALSEGDR